MSGNQVVLSFAGETKDIEQAFDRVGDGSRTMSKKVDESSDSFDRAGEAADTADGKAQGFADVLDGASGTAQGFGDIMKGDVLGGLIGVGGGLSDLFDGMSAFLIPALGKLKTSIMGMNLAFLSSPVFWIIAAVVVLIGVIVLIATKTDWFQRAWSASWKWIKGAAADVWDWLKQLPGWIGTAFSKIASVITWPFRTAFNFIADAWNATIGRLSWTVPNWIPFIGGNTISVPNLPHFHSGGVVPGVPGSEQLAVLQAGEKVGAATGGNGPDIVIRSDGSRLADLLVEVLSQAIGDRGGNVQVVLGGARG